MTVRVRFAPSPTGSLHIGSARTALFNYLFARHHGGAFLLRIEDTDRLRSTKQAVDVIFESLRWLGILWDEEPVFQFEHANRHAAVAYSLLDQGKAYRCFCTQESLELMREQAKFEKRTPKYNRVCRNRIDFPDHTPYTIRLKSSLEGESILNDHVQGTIKVNHNQLDDMVLLRADGSPTYMLSVVVDDHDMGITHVIRGDDHLTNTFRQMQIYQALGWDVPQFAHIPLIHAIDGSKLSKRHGAIGTEYFKSLGVLPQSLRNYLLRLGFSHGNDEIISDKEAIQWFSLEGVGRSPARFDINKLVSLNAHYLRKMNNEDLLSLLPPLKYKERILKGMNSLKERAKTLIELEQSLRFYEEALPPKDDKAKAWLTKDIQMHVKNIIETKDLTEEGLKAYAQRSQLKFSDLAQALRVALTGETISPSLFEIMDILGQEEILRRLDIFVTS